MEAILNDTLVILCPIMDYLIGFIIDMFPISYYSKKKSDLDFL